MGSAVIAGKLHLLRTSHVEDPELVARVARGDLAALGHLYDRYGAPLLAFANRLAGGAQGEDIVQTVFLRVVQRASSFDPEATSARPWLFAMTVKVASEHRRSVRRWTSALLQLGFARSPSSPPLSAEKHDLTKALAGLTAAKRAAVLLVEVEGFTCEEIARMLCVPVGTVWTRLHHARRELRRALEGGTP